MGVLWRFVDMEAGIGMRGVGWGAVAEMLAGPGWVRVRGVVPAAACERLLAAAPSTWSPLDEDEAGTGVVRQGGLACHVEFARSADVVRSYGLSICGAVNHARSSEVMAVPEFNHVQWAKSVDGVGFITRHRDPPAAGGIIAITTLAGRARFRIWDDDGVSEVPSAQHDRDRAHEWDTEDGDLVVLRGGGWPSPRSRCPVHEVESPPTGERTVLTFRYNKGGFGTDYFNDIRPATESASDAR